MKTQLTPRLENAIKVLYNAFHKGELNAMDCSKCAVGNLCDNNPEWDCIYDTTSNFESRLRAKRLIKNTGYSVREIVTIEHLFMYGVKSVNIIRVFSPIKGNEFLGLCAVIKYLCELDGVENVMDYTKLFETEENKPKYQLSL